MKGCTTALVGRLDGNSKRGSLALMPPGFGPTPPHPIRTVRPQKRDPIRGWAQGKDGPGLPFPGAPQARLVELPLVVGVFRSGPLSPSSEWAELPADEATPKVREGPHETYLWEDRIFGPPNHSRRLISAVLLSLGGVLTVTPGNFHYPSLLASHCGRPVH